MTSPEPAKERLWTPANIVTLLRILGVPIFVIAIISPWPSWIPEWSDAEIWKPWVAAGIFILLAATDGLDGYLARSRGEVTNLGKFMDPLADKILVAAALLALIELGVLPSWVALVILSREFIVSGIRMVAASQGVVIAASWYGKAKTVAQIIAIVLFIVKDNQVLLDFSDVLGNRLYMISWLAMAIALVLTIISMLDYFVKARDLLVFSSVSRRKYRDAKTDQASAVEADDSAKGRGAGVSSSGDVVAADVLQGLAADLLRKAASRTMTIGTAESCTGGLVLATLTDIAGSSEAVRGGVISYSNDVKRSALGVQAQTLDRYGAVSFQTACEMAAGARRALDVDIAVSTTGIAGPGGGTPDKPVGTVWIGLAGPDGVAAKLHTFEGPREQVRMQAVQAALEAALSAMSMS